MQKVLSICLIWGNSKKDKKLKFLFCNMYKIHNSYFVHSVNFVNFVNFGFGDSYIYILILYTRTVVLSWCRGVVVSWCLEKPAEETKSLDVCGVLGAKHKDVYKLCQKGATDECVDLQTLYVCGWVAGGAHSSQMFDYYYACNVNILTRVI